MLVHIKEIINKIPDNKYAVGAFNTYNLETTLGIVWGANNLNAPIIIQVSETTIRYAGLKPITHIVETIAKNEAVNAPIALHLDHGKSFHSVVECIDAGFSSIMIDASDLPFDENVALTKQACDYAHKLGAWAQGELGRVKSWEDRAFKEEKFLTVPDEAQEFVERTGIDVLAVAIGNVHGIGKIKQGVPQLDYKRLKEIKAKIGDIPLVLHGASGISGPHIKRAISLGIKVINIDTEIRLAFTNKLRDFLTKEPREIDPRKIFTPATQAVQKIVEEKIKIFTSANKAK